ncbi:MAG: glycosyl transferase, partial [Thermomicrobiales bacterium]|nr:glycosyl transferase [Thermomicrobiales bacterium]
RSYQPNGGAFDDRYLFAGPSLREEPTAAEFPLPPADGRSLVYVSLGTVASDNPTFYRAALAALAERPWRAVVATGRTDPEALGAVPPGIVARPHVPQIAVLRHADLFVTHGGMNSTMEALRLGVPLVVAPQMADQFLNARRVAELGLGRSLEGVEPTPDALLAAADAVLADGRYRERVSTLRDEMIRAGGAERAAAAIQETALALR